MEGYSLEAWKEKGNYTSWNNYKVFYTEEKNEKQSLVLIHGFPTASFDWHKIWDELSVNYHLIAIDMLGFGFSDKPYDFKYTIHQQAGLVLDILKEKGINDFHILAHDYGDTVTQEILARYNEGNLGLKIDSVCLLNGGIFPEAHRALFIQKVLIGPLGFIISRLLTKKKFEKSFGSIFGKNTKPPQHEMDEYWDLVSYKKGHHIAHKIAQYRKERVTYRERWVGALQNFKNKLSLINGPEDPISGIQMVDRYREIISSDNVYLLEGIGHYPQVEAPKEVLTAYSKCVKGWQTLDSELLCRNDWKC